MSASNADDKLQSMPPNEGIPPLCFEVLADTVAVARRAAACVADAARQAIRERSRFLLALSGGRTPQPMFGFLAAEAIDWRQVDVVQVDERIAPLGDPERNLTQLRHLLFSRVPLSAGQIHGMPVEERDLPAAAESYEQLLRRLAGSPPRLDLIVLGLGADGHTASLVPEDPVLDVRDADVALTRPYKAWRRMTLTFPIINRARRVLWLVTGEEKREAVVRLACGDPSLPASRVSRTSSLLLADVSAAAGLPSPRA
jgi:6-phosphogluconolactonase